MRKTLFIAMTVVFVSSPLLFSQEAPSLGEIARKYREEKRLREAALSSPATPQKRPAAANTSTSVDVKPILEVEQSKPTVVPVPPQAEPQQPVAPLVTVQAAKAVKKDKLPDIQVFPAATPQDSPSARPQQTVVLTAAFNKTENVAVKSEAKKPQDVPVFAPVTPQQSSPVKPRQLATINPAPNPELTPETVRLVIRPAPPVMTQQSNATVSPDRSVDQQSEMDNIYSSIGQNLQTPEGEKYNSVFAREFAAKNSRGVRECLETGAKDPGPFDVVVQVSSNGAPQQAMIFPDTGAAGCLRSTLARASFSGPPAPGYWVKVTLTNR